MLRGWQMYGLAGFPAIKRWQHTNTMEFQQADDWVIHGELYEIDNATFQNCDRLEGYPHFYNRTVVEVEGADGNNQAWVYHFEDDTLMGGNKLLKDGVW
jgi:gamma-glutamylcyclotransferase (GGCT)/AIG2-like uncharacterized protein YtfP